MDVGKAIKDACYRRRITQSELARRIGRPRQLVNDWIHNRKRPDLDSLALLDRELDIVRELFPQPAKSDDDTPSGQIIREIMDLKSTIRNLTYKMAT